MNGVGSARALPGSTFNPRASSPYDRAALTMLLALLPSRDTSQATLNSSSGAMCPW